MAKAESHWILKYVKSAIGETDVPDALPEFISQRRRWLNGSFFAATYAVAHVGQIMRSGHTAGRKAGLLAETVYNVINLIASWFGIVSVCLWVSGGCALMGWCSFVGQFLSFLREWSYRLSEGRGLICLYRLS